jgi:eukaryotic-like serine/threonine-protein kinase
VALAALALSGWTLWHSRTDGGKSVVGLSIAMPADRPLVTLDQGNFALSPDGQRIVLTVLQDGKNYLAVRDLSSFELKLIAGTEGASRPFFSPDGEWLVFLCDKKLKKILLSGGTPIVLAPVQNYSGGTWLRNGQIVYTPDWSGGMYRVPASGGKPELLAPPQPGNEQDWQWWPEELPSGDILFTRKTGEGVEEGSIAALSTKTGKWTTLIERATNAHYSPSGHLVYVAQGTIFAVPFDESRLKVTGSPLPVLEGVQTIEGEFAQFAVARNGTLAYVPGPPAGNRNTLVSVDRTGKQAVLASQPQAYEDLALSPDGKQLAMTVVGEQQWSVWIYDLQQKTLNRLTFEGDNRDPIWSADGKRVIYSSSRNGRKCLFWKPVAGTGGEEELLRVASQPFPDSVSMDGRYLAYSLTGARESAGIYLLPLQGERKPQLLFSEPAAGMGTASLSPDGRWIAYASAETQKLQIYVRRFGDGSGKWQVSTEGGSQPWWSANSRELFYRDSAGKMSSVAVSPGTDFVASSPRPLFQFPCVSAGHDYAPTSDAQRFICIKQPDNELTANQVNVVLNWAKELSVR